MNAEELREKIRQMIIASQEGTNITIPPVFEHMMTQICYEFYKIGWKECVRAQKISIDMISEQILK